MTAIIPDAYQKFWQPVTTVPNNLIHQTPQSAARQINASGFIQPRTPLNGLWLKMAAVFMSDMDDETFPEREKGSLKAHFDCSTEPLVTFPVQPNEQIFRCIITERQSDYISLAPVPILQCPYHAIAS